MGLSDAWPSHPPPLPNRGSSGCQRCDPQRCPSQAPRWAMTPKTLRPTPPEAKLPRKSRNHGIEPRTHEKDAMRFRNFSALGAPTVPCSCDPSCSNGMSPVIKMYLAPAALGLIKALRPGLTLNHPISRSSPNCLASLTPQVSEAALRVRSR